MTIQKIAIHGYKGKLGSLICAQARQRNLDVFEITRDMSGDDISQSGAQIIIDVTSAQGLQDLLQKSPTIPILTGSTGDLPWKMLEDFGKISCGCSFQF